MSCAWCEGERHIKQGRIYLCSKHYRMATMRASAKRNGKSVPSYDELHQLADNMTCVGCSNAMTWLRDQGASLQVTLQHDRSGRHRFLCLGCNVRHSVMPGDTFYELSDDAKWCGSCETVLKKYEFTRDSSRPAGLKAYCKKCSSERHKKWREQNAKTI